MSYGKRLVAGAAIIAGLAAGAAPAEAAWWNFGRKDQAPASDDSVRLVQSDGDRLNRLEAEIRTLTGQIEELTYELQQLQNQLKRVQEDVDFRLSDIEGTAAPQPTPRLGEAATADAPAAADGIATIASDTDTGNGEVDVGGSAGPGAPPQPLGTLVMGSDPPPAGEQPLDLSALARGEAAAPAVGLPPPTLDPAAEAPTQTIAVALTGEPRADYVRAYNLIVAGQYDLAEDSFRQFLSAYPNDAAAPDAQFWLGESYFARARFGDAAETFRAGFKAYPQSNRAPETLLKLGMSLAGLGERDAACQIYGQVLKQYPQVANGLRQRVANEQASASC